MADNSNFIPEDVYVELLYKCEGKSNFHKILKPFTTPAAAHKAVMLDLPEYQLIGIKPSEAFEKWYYDNVGERQIRARQQWWEKIDSLLASKKQGGTVFDGLNEDGTVKMPKTESYLQRKNQKLREAYSTVDISDKINALEEATSKAKSDKAGAGLVLIPYHSIIAIGKIFIEGLRYGKNNWKKGVNDKDYQEERLEHALLHLMKWKEGDRTEDHLAKVAWFCVTQLELERIEQNG